jgi:hypothetical protein
VYTCGMCVLDFVFSRNELIKMRFREHEHFMNFVIWLDWIGLDWLFRVNKVEFLPFDVNWTWKPNNPNDKPMYSFNINAFLHWSISS